MFNRKTKELEERLDNLTMRVAELIEVVREVKSSATYNCQRITRLSQEVDALRITGEQRFETAEDAIALLAQKLGVEIKNCMHLENIKPVKKGE